MQSNKKKILITIPSLKKDPGGVARYYNAILPYLYKSNNFEIEIFEIGSTHGKKVFFHPIIDQIKFMRKISVIKPDIIHINPSLNFKSFIRDALFIYWAKRQKKQVIVFFHGWEKKFAKKIQGILKKIFNLTYKKADAFIVLASEFRSKLRLLKIDKPVHILTTAVDELLVESFSIEKKIERIKSSQTIRLLFLSRLEKEKGIFETIDAFKLLLDERYDIALSIAGDGSITKEIYGYIDQLGLSNNIDMLGYVKEGKKIQAFTEHDIYCFPTYYGEGMPTSILEAMALGMPIITRPVGGINDFFETYKMGYLCETTKPYDIAESIKKMICDKKRICDTAQYNYRYAKKHFMAPIVADKLLNIYLNTSSHDRSCYYKT